MSDNQIIEYIGQQDWIDTAATALQKAVSTAYEAAGDAGQKLKDVMHGTWLGHPVHPAVTDIAVGAWTVAVVMDAIDELSPNEGLRRGADTAVAVGLAGATVSAITGLTDWSVIDGRARKVGLVHGLMNIAAFGLFTASMFMRRSGQRAEARALGAFGYAVAFGSAWLGGELAYSEQIGVDHTAGQEFPSEFTPILDDSELAEGQMRRVDRNGARILLARRGGQVYAIAEVCPHLGGPLSEGKFEGTEVTCPWHGSCFSLTDGSIVNGPTVYRAPALETRIQGGRIEVRKK